MGTNSARSARPAGRVSTGRLVLMSCWPQALTEAVVAEAALAPASPWRAEPAWEYFYERALASGVEPELAHLGRALIREARLRPWPEETRIECGLLDDGQAMLELAEREPDTAHARWTALLDGQDAP